MTLQKLHTPQFSPEISDEALLVELRKHWDAHKNLNGIRLPKGVNAFHLALKARMADSTALEFIDAVCTRPNETDGPLLTLDEQLAQAPQDLMVRSLVEHGTPGAISLDICPHSTLIVTVAELRRRLAEGLEIYSLQTQNPRKNGELLIV